MAKKGVIAVLVQRLFVIGPLPALSFRFNTILGGLLIGGVSGGLFGFAGSALSQMKSGRGFDAKQACGARLSTEAGKRW